MHARSSIRDFGKGSRKSVVDPDLLRRKAAQVLHHCGRLDGRSGLTARELDADEDLYNAVLMDLQQAIQACIDLAAHACVDDNLGAPTGAAEAFTLLARAGRIGSAHGIRLVGAAGLRNIIVHRYGELDSQRVVKVIAENLGDLRQFVHALSAAG